MTVKEHYDNLLGNYYSWYTGDFERNKENFRKFCIENEILSLDSKLAIDLGAGNGIQTIALANIGYKVIAIDFNIQLIAELNTRVGNLPVEVINEDFRSVSKYCEFFPELIVCCGDTLTHLESLDEIQKLIMDCSEVLSGQGKIVLSFRDYSIELEDVQRFIPVKSDSQRIMTCFLEYSATKVRVTDIIHELENDTWVQKISSYNKTRVSKEQVIGYLMDSGFCILLERSENRIITIIGQK
jgi:2-polyprenyl-3-methyl-5-hydroxy-6-metoxy-1,4-benzoquinol methylase